MAQLAVARWRRNSLEDQVDEDADYDSNYSSKSDLRRPEVNPLCDIDVEGVVLLLDVKTTSVVVLESLYPSF
jgi:hypothetical protein